MQVELEQYFLLYHALRTTYKIPTLTCVVDDICVICADSMRYNQILQLPCGHMFHDNCFLSQCIVNKWTTCPNCNKEILPQKDQPSNHSEDIQETILEIDLPCLPQNETDLPYYN